MTKNEKVHLLYIINIKMAKLSVSVGCHPRYLSRGMYNKNIPSENTFSEEEFTEWVSALKTLCDEYTQHPFTILDMDKKVQSTTFTYKQIKVILDIIYTYFQKDQHSYLWEHIFYARMNDPWNCEPRYGVEGYYYRRRE